MAKPSNTAKIAHNLGLATWFGGALFGQIAVNPTVRRISDERERGRVLSESWARFHAFNFPAMATTLLTWRTGGLRDDAELRAPALARIKDLLLGGAAFNGIASGLLGAWVASRAPGGATPVRRGTKPAPETPGSAALAQRLIGVFGSGSITLVAAAIAVSAIIESQAVKPRGILSRLLSG